MGGKEEEVKACHVRCEQSKERGAESGERGEGMSTTKAKFGKFHDET